MSLYFDNEKLFDAEGHLTDEGLYALKDGTLDDLGALEAAEHLTFCDYCLLRYTKMIDNAPECLQQPMRDLIPQVQNLMRLRSFRIMTNRYVSAAAAVVLAEASLEAAAPSCWVLEPQPANRLADMAAAIVSARTRLRFFIVCPSLSVLFLFYRELSHHPKQKARGTDVKCCTPLCVTERGRCTFASTRPLCPVRVL